MALRKVKTEHGWVQGAPSGNTAVSVFRSIPYAAPPVGANRWKAPQPHDNWDGVYDAGRFHPIAAQAIEDHAFYSNEFYRFREEMDEDCLYLNIWTPAVTAEEKLPVMFFIHGGGFRSGYSYEIYEDGDAYGRNGVILITFDYRLGCLGYLAHPLLTGESEHHASGNYGLLDQIAALKWVRRNIAAFGGDPDNITISGQSGGSVSVLNMVTSPLTEGDIAKAIMQSGGGYGGNRLCTIPMLSLTEAEKVGEDVFELLGVHTLDEARALPWQRIVEAELTYSNSHSGFLFAPVADGYTQTASCDDAIEALQVRNIPYIVGMNANENGSYAAVAVEPEEAYRRQVRDMLGDHADAFLEVIGMDEDSICAAAHGGLSDMIQPVMLAWCDFMAKQKDRRPSYLYYFNRDMPGDDHVGAYHSAELWYTFKTIHRCWRPMQGIDYHLADVVNDYWCNFARTGDPNGKGLPHWTPYSSANRAGMELGERIGMLDDPGAARTHFLRDYIMGRI